MENKVIAMVTTLGLVLTVGVLTTIYSQQAFAVTTHCQTGPVCGGYGGNAGTGGNGGTCTNNNCNANGGSGNGGNGGNSNGGQGENGKDATGSIACIDHSRTIASSDGRTITQKC